MKKARERRTRAREVAVEGTPGVTPLELLSGFITFIAAERYSTRPRRLTSLCIDSLFMDRISFPEGFIWGAASAAYQVEGSPLADGAGPTTWHEFSHRKGRIRDGSTGDVACDHYNRAREDVQVMRLLGLKAYRFSTGWARIFAEPGRVNQRGLDFYDRLIDALLAAGIQPWLTIFHMEEPLWLARMGGFVRRQSVDHLVGAG